IPVAVHVSGAESGQAVVFRRDPAARRRISAASGRLSAAGSKAAAVKSGMAHPFRASAADRDAALLCDVARAGVVFERGKRGHIVGLYWPLPAGCDATNASEAE